MTSGRCYKSMVTAYGSLLGINTRSQSWRYGSGSSWAVAWIINHYYTSNIAHKVVQDLIFGIRLVKYVLINSRTCNVGQRTYYGSLIVNWSPVAGLSLYHICMLLNQGYSPRILSKDILQGYSPRTLITETSVYLLEMLWSSYRPGVQIWHYCHIWVCSPTMK